MQITFTSLPGDQQDLRLEYPKEFSSEEHLEERRSAATTSWGTLQLRECWFDGACLLCSEFDVYRHSRMKLQCDSFCWLMNFILKGEVVSSVSGHPQITLQEGKYHTFYCPVLNMDLEVGCYTKVYTVCLTRRFIRKLLGKELLPEQFESGGNETLTLVSSDDYRNNRLSTLIKEMLQAAQAPYIRRIFLEARILELLSLQLESLEKKQQVPENLNPEDIVRLNEAKNIVEQNLQTPCSLIELARKTGLNDFKLKKGFKTLFGYTVFGYLAELRMETACRLLKEGQSVSEVAEAVGYKNPHHFTAAFKKKYGLLPSQAGRLLILLISSIVFCFT